MKKRILSLLVALCLVCGLLPLSALAAGEELTYAIPETNIVLTYTVGADGSATITGCNEDAAGELVIPSEIEGHAVTTIGDIAFNSRAGLTSVTIPDSVASIGDWAFLGCSNLQEFRISSATTQPDVWMFQYCYKLERYYVDGKLLPCLDAPTDLSWGVLSDGEQLNNMAGITFYTRGKHQSLWQVELYRVGEDKLLDRHGGNYHSINNGVAFTSMPWFENRINFSDLEGGSYYFVAQNLGDCVNYWKSERVQSPVLNYIRPGEAVDGIPTESLFWDGTTMKWSEPQDTSNIYGYEVTMYFSETSDGNAERKLVNHSLKPEMTLPDEIIQSFGDGYYYFRVYALSKDMTKYLHSEWSELSPALHIHDAIADVNNALTAIPEDADVREKVQKIDQTDLKTALLADKNEEGGTADLLKQLEAKTGLGVEVAVAEDFQGIAASGVDIVGAALNDVPADTEKITLKIDRPAEEHVIPTMYNNAVSLQFSMGLDGVTNQEDLKVPVRVTLPVPATINPDFLVLLHYGADGSVETINTPYVFQENGQWYASIVLTHFSDFVMTEEKQNTPTPSPSPGGSTTATPPVEDEKPALNAVEVFTDVSSGAWYVDAVNYVLNEKLMTGIAADTFSPNSNLTRAMLAQVLYNKEDRPNTSGTAFTDVASGVWYANAVAWAAEKGIVEGNSNGAFAPEDNITREQLAVMLWRYAGKPAITTDLNGYRDMNSASDWALPALQWAVSKGVMSGKGGGILDPAGYATRAEVAQMLMNYFQDEKNNA